jgi:hypothetical protein
MGENWSTFTTVLFDRSTVHLMLRHNSDQSRVPSKSAALTANSPHRPNLHRIDSFIPTEGPHAPCRRYAWAPPPLPKPPPARKHVRRRKTKRTIQPATRTALPFPALPCPALALVLSRSLSGRFRCFASLRFAVKSRVHSHPSVDPSSSGPCLTLPAQRFDPSHHSSSSQQQQG